MKLPEYLSALRLNELPVDYPWDNDISNAIWATNDDDNPRLAHAVQSISVKAAFALGIACSEWIVARVEGHVDTKDALLRIEAARAALLDRRYANLPRPPPSQSPELQPYEGPLRLSMKLVSEAFSHFKGSGDDVSSATHAQIVLVQHIAGRHPAYEPWITEVLQRCHAHFPQVDEPVEKQAPVPMELFEPNFKWNEQVINTYLARFVASLDPGSNPYLQTPEKMKALRFKGTPYAQST